MRIYNIYKEQEKRKRHQYYCNRTVNLWEDYVDESRGDTMEVEEEMIKWLEDNTEGRVHCSGDMVFDFELEDDAVLFKLTWS